MRRLREELNFLCSCGHTKREHDLDDYSGVCLNAHMRLCSCECMEYRRDNLLYLEKLVNAKS